jgi:hypothetical protein
VDGHKERRESGPKDGQSSRSLGSGASTSKSSLRSGEGRSSRRNSDDKDEHRSSRQNRRDGTDAKDHKSTGHRASTRIIDVKDVDVKADRRRSSTRVIDVKDVKDVDVKADRRRSSIRVIDAKDELRSSRKLEGKDEHRSTGKVGREVPSSRRLHHESSEGGPASKPPKDKAVGRTSSSRQETSRGLGKDGRSTRGVTTEKSSLGITKDRTSSRGLATEKPSKDRASSRGIATEKPSNKSARGIASGREKLSSSREVGKDPSRGSDKERRSSRHMLGDKQSSSTRKRQPRRTSNESTDLPPIPDSVEAEVINVEPPVIDVTSYTETVVEEEQKDYKVYDVEPPVIDVTSRTKTPVEEPARSETIEVSRDPTNGYSEKPSRKKKDPKVLDKKPAVIDVTSVEEEADVDSQPLQVVREIVEVPSEDRTQDGSETSGNVGAVPEKNIKVSDKKGAIDPVADAELSVEAAVESEIDTAESQKINVKTFETPPLQPLSDESDSMSEASRAKKAAAEVVLDSKQSDPDVASPNQESNSEKEADAQEEDKECVPEYNEEDMFSWYSWSHARQEDPKIQQQRIMLREASLETPLRFYFQRYKV